MLFSSITFLYFFLPIVVLIYYIIPHAWRNYFLFFASILFYAWGEPVYVLLMLVSIVITYITGIYAGEEHYKVTANNTSNKRRFFLLAAVILNIGLLVLFKYLDPVIVGTNEMLQLHIEPLGLKLPIGISFYTFQSLSYVVDVYTGRVKTQKNIFYLGTYIALFPQLIAGPIVRYSDIEEQLQYRKESFDKAANGIARFCVGLGKKVILANSIGALFESISNTPMSELSVIAVWLAFAAFAFQIYFDFSGYSDMAIGLGLMFGFEFSENFNYPYISKSITEFWRRWHISLSSWFRDYVYIPLGGNRKGILRQIVNILIVWGLTGLWHGANLNYLLWGLFWGLVLLSEKLILGKVLKKLPGLLQHFYVIVLILIGWCIFAFNDLDVLFQNLKAAFGLSQLPFINEYTQFLLGQNAVYLIAAAILSTPVIMIIGKKIKNKATCLYQNFYTPIKCVLLLVVCSAYIISGSYNPFLYFRF